MTIDLLLFGITFDTLINRLLILSCYLKVHRVYFVGPYQSLKTLTC